jgi:flagellin
MVSSVNTNAGALIALQNLNSTSKQLATVQGRINTGLKVAGAKDNGAIFAIAQNLRSDVAGLNAVKGSLDRGISAVDVAVAAGETISDLLIQMKEKAVAASDTGLDTASRDALKADFEALRDQITTIVDNAEFNGTNLIKNSGSSVVAIVNDKGTQTITVAAQDLSLTGTTVTIATTTTFSTATAAASAVTLLESSISAVNSALATLGTGSKKLAAQRTFVDKLSDVIDVGIGNLVDADLAKESARLQSLQVKQQLGIQALSIANQAPSTVLALFR